MDALDKFAVPNPAPTKFVPVTEQFVRLAETPPLPEPPVVEILHLNRQTRSDVLGDLVEPAALFLRERDGGLRLLLPPRGVALPDHLGERRERLARSERVPD